MCMAAEQTILSSKANSPEADNGRHAASLGELRSPKPAVLPCPRDRIKEIVGKVGADIFITHNQLISALDTGTVPSRDSLERFVVRIRILDRYLNGYGDTLPSDNRLVRSLSECVEKLYREYPVSKDQDISAVRDAVHECFARCKDLHAELSWRTVLDKYPGARSLNLLLLDYETRVLGVPRNPLVEVANLHNRLLVDPSKRIPQEGFLRHIPPEELFPTAQLPECRLLTALKDGELWGFSLGTFHVQNSIQWLGENYERLIAQGVIRSEDKLGCVHMLGTERADRPALRRNNIHLYSIFTERMSAVAKEEGVNVMVGAVRGGENANTAIKSHLRQGWQLTECEYLGSDGCTPYHVLVYRLSENSIEPARMSLGEVTYYEIPRNYQTPPSSEVQDAYAISDEAAIALLDRHLNKEYHRFEISRRLGERLYISVSVGSRTVNLHQIVPGVDYWLLFGRDEKGSLEKLCPAIRAALGYDGTRHRIC